MTITTTAPALSSAGISAPSYADILDYLKAQYRTIYGADVYLEADSQDGQFLAIIATSINDANSAAIAVYNAFSPSTAQGTGLSSVVKINGMRRAVASNSTVSLTLTGTAGIAITNGIVQDSAKNNWALPALVNIPGGGSVTVTATCVSAGAVSALPHSVNFIITPQLGWQTADNASAAVLGAPVETDAALRARQSASVAPSAVTPLVTVLGQVAAVSGVTRFTGYDNPTGSADSNGIPAHSIAVVVEGGDSTAIATAIANAKTIGAGTAGTTTVSVVDLYGVTRPISFYPVTDKRILVSISLHPVSGYTTAIGASIQAAVAAYINALPIGADVFYTRMFSPANLNGAADGLTYEIISLGIAISPGSPGTSDLVIGFTEAAHCDASDVTISLV